MANPASSYSDFFKRRNKDSRRSIPEKDMPKNPRKGYPDMEAEEDGDDPTYRTQPYTGGAKRDKPSYRRKTPNPSSSGANGVVAAARKEALKARLKYKKFGS